jgi:hypothetical protein
MEKYKIPNLETVYYIPNFVSKEEEIQILDNV